MKLNFNTAKQIIERQTLITRYKKRANKLQLINDKILLKSNVKKK